MAAPRSEPDEVMAGRKGAAGEVSSQETAPDRGGSGEGALPEHEAARRYFAKFERITGYLHTLADVHLREDAKTAVAEQEVACIEDYLQALSHTFAALSTKYLMTGLVTKRAQPRLEIDRTDSGFPVFGEIMRMANDLGQADRHLRDLPDRQRIKGEIVDHILSKHTIPRKLQFALSQRIYYETLVERPVFLAQNDPSLAWLGNVRPDRRQFLIHWAVYDSQRNLPNIYVMIVEDTGRKPLHRDDERWPLVQSHLMAQSLSTLKLLTIARGFDKDFQDIHPKYLKRIYVGPMYSNTFTSQRSEVRDILAEAGGQPGQDWLLAWTSETLVSQETRAVRSGLFGSVPQEVFALDHADASAFDSGASETERSIILPYRPYQALLAGRAPTLERYKRYVVGPDEKILAGA